MLVLHVLQGFQVGGVDSLALHIAESMPAICTRTKSHFLNADRNVVDFLDPFLRLQESGVIACIHYWKKSDGLILAFRAYKLCSQLRPDALIIYPCNRPMLWLALGARLAGVRRLAVHLGNTAPADHLGLRIWHRLLRWFQRLGVVPVPCTQAIVDSLQPLPRGLRLGPVIANGCDVQAIAQRAAAARARRPPSDPRRVLMVARLDPIKDQATLLRAFAAVRPPGWELQLVGEGPDRPRLETLATELGLDPAEVFLGRRSDIPELLGQADLFAFSTTPAEGFGIALIEAMAAGLPILASDVSACREVLNDGECGVLLAPRDFQAWTECLAKLMNSTANLQGMARQSQSRAKRFDIQRTAECWYQLLSGNSYV